ncbi:MAG: tyrosine--tRNA ligase [bacterium]|nr:tyrosine--tRNA ligase [bacterium]MDE0288311.1 tyrosine--tRNA ligase [bacterium]MDE0438746.1 tyrosine--tRNA ligase [bacterium]
MSADQSKSPEQQAEELLHDVDTCLPEGELVERLRECEQEGRQLRVKLGLDPTANVVTLGWAVVLWKLRQFQDLGHKAVLILGTFTAQVGDPSGQSETRKRLTAAQVEMFANSVKRHFGKILSTDEEKLEIRPNHEWLGSLNMREVLELTSSTTLAQMLERDDFSKRFAHRRPISMTEFMYPLLQGYDSVAVEADIELGGTDQLFNLMMGRQVQQRYGQTPQMVLTMPLLVGTDGKKKMSQSLGNYISISEPYEEMFGKTMSIPDAAMPQWFRLASGLPRTEVDEVLAGLADGTLHPGKEKRRLARAVVDRYLNGYGEVAEQAFDRQFLLREVPDDIPTHPLPSGDPETAVVYLPALLADAGLVASKSEGRRMLAQGAVRIDGKRETRQRVTKLELLSGIDRKVISVGKRRFVRLGDSPLQQPRA